MSVFEEALLVGIGYYLAFVILLPNIQAVGECPGQCVNFMGDLDKEIRAVCGDRAKLIADVEELMRRTEELLLATAALAGRGAVYTRWGRTVCPNSSELLYAGYAGGSYYKHGGGANYLCLPPDPQTASPVPGMQACGAFIYGAEYEVCSAYNQRLYGTENGNDFDDEDVPCAVCLAAPRLSHMSIPAKTQCPANWTMEYQGYLVGGRPRRHSRMWECMDANPEIIPGRGANKNGALFYFAEAVCTSLPCPPYVAGDEITCVVCTK